MAVISNNFRVFDDKYPDFLKTELPRLLEIKDLARLARVDKFFNKLLKSYINREAKQEYIRRFGTILDIENDRDDNNWNYRLNSTFFNTWSLSSKLYLKGKSDECPLIINENKQWEFLPDKVDNDFRKNMRILYLIIKTQNYILSRFSESFLRSAFHQLETEAKLSKSKTQWDGILLRNELVSMEEVVLKKQYKSLETYYSHFYPGGISGLIIRALKIIWNFFYTLLWLLSCLKTMLQMTQNLRSKLLVRNVLPVHTSNHSNIKIYLDLNSTNAKPESKIKLEIDCPLENYKIELECSRQWETEGETEENSRDYSNLLSNLKSKNAQQYLKVQVKSPQDWDLIKSQIGTVSQIAMEIFQRENLQTLELSSADDNLFIYFHPDKTDPATGTHFFNDFGRPFLSGRGESWEEVIRKSPLLKGRGPILPPPFDFDPSVLKSSKTETAQGLSSQLLS